MRFLHDAFPFKIGRNTALNSMLDMMIRQLADRIVRLPR